MRTNPALDRVGSHPIAAIQQRARDLRDAGGPLIDFAIGDPREPTPALIPAALRQAVPEISQYPTVSGLAGLREAVSAYVGRRFGVEVDPITQVLPTSGAKEAIFSTALAFVDRHRNDAVAWPDPGYPVYERGAVLAGAESVAIATDANFVLTASSVPAEMWARLALLWICTPSNPTGAITGRADLEELVARAREHDVLVCSDECYVDLYDDEVPVSILEVAGTGSAGVLSYLSLSKRSGMTGYRSGVVVGDPEAIARLVRLRTSTGTAPPEFVQAAAIAAWSDDDHVAQRRRTFSAKRQVLRKAFEEMGMEVAGSAAGLYLWVKVEGDDVAVARRLLDAGIVVSPGRIFGSRGHGYLRLALVPTVEECRAAARALVAVLSSDEGPD